MGGSLEPWAAQRELCTMGPVRIATGTDFAFRFSSKSFFAGSGQPPRWGVVLNIERAIRTGPNPHMVTQ